MTTMTGEELLLFHFGDDKAPRTLKRTWAGHIPLPVVDPGPLHVIGAPMPFRHPAGLVDVHQHPPLCPECFGTGWVTRADRHCANVDIDIRCETCTR